MESGEQKVQLRYGWGSNGSFNAAFVPLKPLDLGYQMREPTQSEVDFFNKNPNVAGMATEDEKVIFNPAWAQKATPQQQQGLYMIEAARLYMKKDDSWKGLKFTPEQENFFRSMNDPYYSKLGDLTKQTLVSRIIGGDEIPNAPYTKEQIEIADTIMKNMKSRKK